MTEPNADPHVDLGTILNWQRIDTRITTSGQPSAPQLADIARSGVRHVINLGLHTHERALPDEPGDVARLGMRYTHIPVAFDHPTPANFSAFVTALDATAPHPVHVHCIMNWRVSAFFYKRARDVLHEPEPAARARMLAIWTPDPVWSAFLGLESPCTTTTNL